MEYSIPLTHVLAIGVFVDLNTKISTYTVFLQGIYAYANIQIFFYSCRFSLFLFGLIKG